MVPEPYELIGVWGGLFHKLLRTKEGLPDNTSCSPERSCSAAPGPRPRKRPRPSASCGPDQSSSSRREKCLVPGAAPGRAAHHPRRAHHGTRRAHDGTRRAQNMPMRTRKSPKQSRKKFPRSHSEPHPIFRAWLKGASRRTQNSHEKEFYTDDL